MKHKNIPKGYKDSPLGIIPKEWEVKTIGEACDIHVGKDLNLNSYSKKCDNTHIYPVYSNTVDANGWYGGYYNFEEYKGNCVTVVGRGVGLGTAFYRDKGFGAIGRLLVLYSDKCDAKYLSEYINGKVEIFVESAAIPQLTGKQIANYRIAVPPIEEQRKISKILSVWDEAIAKQTKLINALTRRKRALTQLLLTGNKRLPNFTESWKKVSYHQILKEIKRTLKWNDDELYRLISVKRRSGGIFERGSLYGKDIKTKNLRPVYEGDFLISKMQIVHGASGLTTPEFNNAKISGSYLALIAKDKKLLNMNYLNWWSKTPQFYHQTFISSYGVHIEKMTFDLDSLMSLNIKLPPIDEQIAIIKVLNIAEYNIKLAQKYLDALHNQKHGLIQQLLTGNKRVKT